MPSQRRYICSFCARPFSRSEHKSRHERSHTKEKPFHCDQCSSCFVRRDLLQRHLRTVHSKEKLIKKQKIESIIQEQADPVVSASNIHMDDDIFHYNQDSIITILTLSKKFQSKEILNWATCQNFKLPIVSNKLLSSLDQHLDLLYVIKAFGIIEHDPKQADFMLSKAWSIISTIPHPRDSITSLTIIAYLMLNHNINFIPIGIIMNKLNESTCFLVENDMILFNYWIIYDLLSEYSFHFNKLPMGIHDLVLEKSLPNTNNSLKLIINSFTKSQKVDIPQDSQILINCLKNEIQCLKFNSKSLMFDNHEVLHNVIIMFTKSFQSKSINQGTQGTPINDLINLEKRYLLLNCPLKFQDLINEYLTPITSKSWDILYLNLYEFNNNFNPISINQIIKASNHNERLELMQNYMDSLNLSKFNNNLGILGIPIIFLSKIQDFKPNFKYSKELIIEFFLILLKVFQSTTEVDNPVIQSLEYLINEINPSSENIQTKIIRCFDKWIGKLKLSWDLTSLNQTNKVTSPISPISSIELLPSLSTSSTSSSISSTSSIMNEQNYNFQKMPGSINQNDVFKSSRFDIEMGKIKLPPLNIGSIGSINGINGINQDFNSRFV
ncbi:Zinc finger protein [Wickerhamomyces ciferrii]|uniref:Zinc finger protein n=1 Tax=Wickerhamomyces ciferrii (strain ATCC 14091 / BCRC 22168 / CBS 111 / JCM 3599 / NBRC 0793 / NRRL Y-1031 F-60-10) TaxID=1206466 RepID=K0KL62_WICCF|nr:Zinc finger protein [Wickerhamomyces ciferrii]CCH42922.1 Zinc finger protein [Wickerhamomyces ciferrii]